MCGHGSIVRGIASTHIAVDLDRVVDCIHPDLLRPVSNYCFIDVAYEGMLQETKIITLPIYYNRIQNL